MKVAFLDRDGTLIWEPPESRQVDSLEKLRLLPGVVRGLKVLRQAGFELVLVTNQDGLGSPAYPRRAFELCQRELERQLERHGIRFHAVLVCPHLESERCRCRKPRTGLVEEFSGKISPGDSLMVGDRKSDADFARNLNIRYVTMRTNTYFPRLARARRTTTETSVEVFLNLDGSGRGRIHTGLGFFDHMLEVLARQSLVDLELQVRGDLEVDEHHTVEDAALVLGRAMARALGKREGIERYGFWAPMDEALAGAVLDLSGRPCFRFQGRFLRERVGELPTELVPHFFESLSRTLGAGLHLALERGENEHHKIEALFKAFGRALRSALRRCPHEAGIPSSKGVLS